MIGPNLTATIPVNFNDPLAVADGISIDGSRPPAPSVAISSVLASLSADRRSIAITGVAVSTATLGIFRGGALVESVRIEVEDPPHVRRAITAIAPNTVIEGAWHGRDARGARLIAEHTFMGETLLRLSSALGLTLRNVAFEVGDASGPTCLDIMPSVPPAVMRGMAVRGCSFTGGDATLVRLGPTPVGIVPGDPHLGTWLRATPTNYGSDASCIAFDECEFRPRSGGIGLSIRTQESVPFRLRACDFVGVARAMISSWMGSYLLEGCRFDNAPPSTPRPSPGLGFEEPDGADVYLRNDPPSEGRWPSGERRRIHPDRLSYFTATGCVSLSPRFLSSAHPLPGGGQRQESAILLLNVRHVSPRVDGISVIWGMINEVSSISAIGDRRTARLGRASPLVILGGQYSGSFWSIPGATNSVVVGARGVPGWEDGGLMRIVWPRDVQGVGFYQPTDIFGLDYDRR